ncbi:MAG: hypothetical protein VKL59_14985 [Nostocaceae cyanobacterium]|nr:hypothetical protein [Nostocaceae cyanobacterium]
MRSRSVLEAYRILLFIDVLSAESFTRFAIALFVWMRSLLAVLSFKLLQNQ